MIQEILDCKVSAGVQVRIMPDSHAGKGNEDWNYSAPHGAGRIMSRSEAKRQLNMEEFTSSMDGIFSTSVNEYTIDESPMAYKDSNMIMEAILPTVVIIEVIKPILNLKSNE